MKKEISLRLIFFVVKCLKTMYKIIISMYNRNITKNNERQKTVMNYICEDCKQLSTPTQHCNCESEDITEEYVELLDLIYS